MAQHQARTADLWRLTGWKFAAPGLLLLAIVMGFPLVYAVILSLSSFTLMHPKLAPFAQSVLELAARFKMKAIRQFVGRYMG